MYSARTACSNQENTTVCDVVKLWDHDLSNSNTSSNTSVSFSLQVRHLGNLPDRIYLSIYLPIKWIALRCKSFLNYQSL